MFRFGPLVGRSLSEIEEASGGIAVVNKIDSASPDAMREFTDEVLSLAESETPSVFSMLLNMESFISFVNRT